MRRDKHVAISQIVQEISASVEDTSGSAVLRISRLMYPVIREMNLVLMPNFRTVKVVVQSNGTAPLPDDVIRPVKVFALRKDGDKEVLFQLGKQEYKGTPLQIECNTTEPLPVRTIELPNYVNSGSHPFYFHNPFYGESYGRRESRFFGFYAFNAIENRIEFTGPPTGEVILVTYESSQDACKVVPAIAVPSIRARVLQQFYETVDPNKAQYYFRELRRANRNYKSYVMSGNSYEDYLDWVTSEHANNPR